ncbi:heavy metal-binding domain-containing protein [Sulfobacillus harzensis]|uniref:YbjQ family protein n=1 Tax=Sulfobacillus harzensis TaxID=2729629 RepID=A0A7Y0L784_9FIRM|nr:heavy metal-binding domain-containing protein [Sulfobacillus harzensis]NMP24582.1 YbjQ family protein [Sulfobacillus harzensis]
MPWFKRGSGNDKPDPNQIALSKTLQGTFRQYNAETEEQMRRDREALERGGIPEAAETRVKKTVSGQLPWMSTLDINDLYLADEIRMTPLVQVTGSCYYQAATDSGGRIYLDSNYDAANLVHAYYRAKNDAVDRMSQEAALAGAHAIVDAKFTFSRNQTVVECSVIGTAVSFDGIRPGKSPLISPLSGEEFYKLLQVGWMPTQFCLGYHWHCMPVGYRTRSINSMWNFANQELTPVVERFSDTRRYAVQQMAVDARGGPRVDGFVGVSVKTEIEETELRIYAGYGGYGLSGFGMMGNGITIDGTFFPYGSEGVAEVPAYNLEFFATGAGVAHIGQGRLKKEDIGAFLSALN